MLPGKGKTVKKEKKSQETVETGAVNRVKEKIEKFLDYLRYERKASNHTIASYGRDLQQFSLFAQNEGLKLASLDQYWSATNF